MKCQVCGKVCKNAAGYGMHMVAHAAKGEVVLDVVLPGGDIQKVKYEVMK